jgi:hypothetical protein
VSQPQLLWRRANKATLDTLRGNSPGQYDIRLGKKQEVRRFFEGFPQIRDHKGLRTDIWTQPALLPNRGEATPPYKLEIRWMSETSKRGDLYIRSQRPDTAHPLWRPGVGPSNRTRRETDYAVLLRTRDDRFFAGWLRKAQLRSLPQALRERLEKSDGVGVAALGDGDLATVFAVLGQETPEEGPITIPGATLPAEGEPAMFDPIELEKASAQEGQSKIVQHAIRERDGSLRRKRIALAGDQLVCEACGFDFERVYGERGRGFVECHHKIPLAKASADTRTKLEDLALLCANCHRMVHRRPELTVEALKELLAEAAST